MLQKYKKDETIPNLIRNQTRFYLTDVVDPLSLHPLYKDEWW